MNIRKNIDYSTMFYAMRVAMSADMSQTKLYYELGRLICQRTEKGAAVAAAEYLQRNYPDVPGLSPRNLRRMRDFYRMYEGNPEFLDLAMQIGWTQNVVILEADLNTEERRWYLCAVQQLGWSKAELQRKIKAQAHLQVYLDESESQCYTGYDSNENEISSEKCGPRTSQPVGYMLNLRRRFLRQNSPSYVVHEPSQRSRYILVCRQFQWNLKCLIKWQSERLLNLCSPSIIHYITSFSLPPDFGSNIPAIG